MLVNMESSLSGIHACKADHGAQDADHIVFAEGGLAGRVFGVLTHQKQAVLDMVHVLEHGGVVQDHDGHAVRRPRRAVL